jgi:hypothetical protein
MKRGWNMELEKKEEIMKMRENVCESEECEGEMIASAEMLM